MSDTSSRPVVSTRAGKVRGVAQRSAWSGDEFYAFKGVPYAKPPVGQLRFLDPQPAEPWTDTRDASAHGSLCAQVDPLTNSIVGSDDCLYLNVYARSVSSNTASRRRRPVMVWIHGGGFVNGSGDETLYGPDYLLRRDVVVVTINYRLGVFGFLNLEDDEAPGNQGLKDQVMALGWVRDNIANFGGEPDNVTIFGESAGGASVHYLCLSPLAKGLFHKAIIQSGVAINPWANMVRDPRKLAYRLCQALGLKTRDSEKILDFLRAADHRKMIEAQENLLTETEKAQFMFPFGPGVDAKSKEPFMPEHPEVAYKRGVQVPLLIGYNSREGIIHTKYISDPSKFNDDFESLMHPSVVELMRGYNATAEELRHLYFGGHEITRENRDKLYDLLGDTSFVEGVQRVVKAQIERSCSPTYLYQFCYDKESLIKTFLNIDVTGASHADELAFLFRTKIMEGALPPLEEGSVRRRLTEQMTDMWVNFASTGIPTSQTSDTIPVYWLPVSNDTLLRYLRIDVNLRMEVTLALEQRYCNRTVARNKL